MMTCIRFIKIYTIEYSEQYVAACSEDMTIKVNRRDPAESFELTEHSGPVLRIDLSANGLLASSSGDGTIKIWNLDEKKCIKTISGFDKIKSYQVTQVFGTSTRFCMLKSVYSHIFLTCIVAVTPSFEPKYGKFMAYNQEKSIIIVDTQNWAVKKTLTDEKVHSIFTQIGIFFFKINNDFLESAHLFINIYVFVDTLIPSILLHNPFSIESDAFKI